MTNIPFYSMLNDENKIIKTKCLPNISCFYLYMTFCTCAEELKYFEH